MKIFLSALTRSFALRSAQRVSKGMFSANPSPFETRCALLRVNGLEFLKVVFVSLFSLALVACAKTPFSDLKPQSTQITNGHLEYYAFGHGSPVVLIEGYATDVTSWDKRFLLALAADHRVIVFNNRGVGGSWVNSESYTPHDLAADTHELIEGLHLQAPAVIGISMGGMIAEELAILYPQSVGKLILINTAVPGAASIRPSEEVEEHLLDMPTSHWGRYTLALHYFFPKDARRKMAYDLAVDRFQPDIYEEIDIAKVIPLQKEFLRAWLRDETSAAQLSQLKMPVLILNGLADEVLPPENSVILQHHIPHAQLVRWQNGGHAMIYQFPDSLAAAINQFLKG